MAKTGITGYNRSTDFECNMKKGFFCPKCGHGEFKILDENHEYKVLTEIKSHLDFIDSICLKCGYTITGDNIKDLIENFRNELIKKLKEFKL